jgi:hypothetical protein
MADKANLGLKLRPPPLLFFILDKEKKEQDDATYQGRKRKQINKQISGRIRSSRVQ